MADISWVWNEDEARRQVLLAHVDQLVAEAWDMLGDDGYWVGGLDDLLRHFAASDVRVVRTLGLLSQVGYNHMLSRVELPHP